ncbi:suppressor of fused domain protein [Mycolicibacterium sp. CH28]|uniref:suppressor of fused domain protein n=1 Tax=Mycolicibacterium sp. CH28 TaxID=2512237 RepID=UPI0010810CCF|nr:suppressor of fused domain protein [Mycolicibacterium sp. CH28]TGD88015.1 suppressor of fused domain protein [Mycolicibacterium sp. CH28]
MSQPTDLVRAHVRGYFADAGIETEPVSATVTFLGLDRIDVLRFGPGLDGVAHYVTLGCSRHPMAEPTAGVADPLRGPRAEIVMSLRASTPTPGLARSLAVVAATPVVEGVVLVADALIDLSTPLWDSAAFTAVLLGDSGIADLPLAAPREPVRFLAAVPITPTEAAWVRLKGAEAMRQAWVDDGVDVLDPNRRAARPG